MFNNKLREIRLLLDTIPGDVDDTATPDHCTELVEETAISILDSQFTDFEAGLLEEFLLDYLRVRRWEYGLIDINDPEPVER